jgi:hypothetical protein
LYCDDVAVITVTMSFGYSVGDIIAVYQLTSKIRKQFIDAPAQFKAIPDE